MGWDPNPVYRRALLMQIENVTRPRLFSAVEAAKKKRGEEHLFLTDWNKTLEDVQHKLDFFLYSFYMI
jgi:hypothetical protein